LTTQGDLLHLNVAIIAPKENNNKLPDDPSAFETDFFGARGGNGTNRAIDFSNALNSNQFRCAPINTDKWVVLRHYRMKLGVPAVNGAPAFHKTLDTYVKVNRQIQFSSDGEDASVQNPIYMVFWADDVMAIGGASGRPNAYACTIQPFVYFRDPK